MPRTRRRVSAFVHAAALSASVVGCAALPPRSAAAPTPHAAPRRVHALSASDADAAVRASIATITTQQVAADLEALAQPRSAFGSSARLAWTTNHLKTELLAAGMRVRLQHVRLGTTTSENVIAERPGADPSRVVMVTAHYDSVDGSPGADDDASGCAAVLAVARASVGVALQATLRVVLFTLEEQGLVGSLAYVHALDPAERARVRAVFNVEMIGYRTTAPGSQRFPPGIGLLARGRTLPTAGDFVAAMGLRETPGPLETLRAAQAFVPTLRAELLALPRLLLPLVPDLSRSDHAPFWLAGIPAVILGDTADFRTPHYHTPHDTVDTLDLGFVTDVTRWVAAAALLTAQPVERP